MVTGTFQLSGKGEYMKPSEEYTIKILSDEDFNKLPYPKAKESLGMSVMDKKTAYIRRTGVKELDQHTIEHEFDELMQEVSPHEINGIRYKDNGFISTFKSLLPRILFGIGAPVAEAVASKLFAPKQQAQPQQSAASNFQPSNATSAFAPQTLAPLGEADFNTSLSNLSKNASLQEKSIMDRFRGRTTSGDTAYNRTLTNSRTSSELAKNQFLDDQKQLGSLFA